MRANLQSVRFEAEPANTCCFCWQFGGDLGLATAVALSLSFGGFKFTGERPKYALKKAALPEQIPHLELPLRSLIP